MEQHRPLSEYVEYKSYEVIKKSLQDINKFMSVGNEKIKQLRLSKVHSDLPKELIDTLSFIGEILPQCIPKDEDVEWPVPSDLISIKGIRKLNQALGHLLSGIDLICGAQNLNEKIEQDPYYFVVCHTLLRSLLVFMKKQNFGFDAILKTQLNISLFNYIMDDLIYVAKVPGKNFTALKPDLLAKRLSTLSKKILDAFDYYLRAEGLSQIERALDSIAQLLPEGTEELPGDQYHQVTDLLLTVDTHVKKTLKFDYDGCVEKRQNHHYTETLLHYQRRFRTYQARFEKLEAATFANDEQLRLQCVQEHRAIVAEQKNKFSQAQLAKTKPEKVILLQAELPKYCLRLKNLIKGHELRAAQLLKSTKEGDFLVLFSDGIKKLSQAHEQGENQHDEFSWLWLKEYLHNFTTQYKCSATATKIQTVIDACVMQGRGDWHSPQTSEQYLLIANALNIDGYTQFAKEYTKFSRLDHLKEKFARLAFEFHNVEDSELSEFLRGIQWDETQITKVKTMQNTKRAQRRAAHSKGIAQDDIESLERRQKSQYKLQATTRRLKEDGPLTALSYGLKSFFTPGEVVDTCAAEMLKTQDFQKTDCGRLLMAYEEYKVKIEQQLKAAILHSVQREIESARQLSTELAKVKQSKEECVQLLKDLQCIDLTATSHVSLKQQHEKIRNTIRAIDLFVIDQMSIWLRLAKNLAKIFNYQRHELPYRLQMVLTAKEWRTQLQEQSDNLTQYLKQDCTASNGEKAQVALTAHKKTFEVTEQASSKIIRHTRHNGFFASSKAKHELSRIVRMAYFARPIASPSA